MTPKVSIIVPCYGVEKYLDRCMESLVNQTLRDIEIILVDDVSPDRVPEMCDDWAEKDSRIKVIHKEMNEGLGYARNSGIEIAQGEYVAFVDSDDFVDSCMYAPLYREAKKSNADAVFCGFKVEEKNSSWTEKSEVEDRTEFRTKKIDSFVLDMIASAPRKKIERRYWMSVWHAIYKRDIIENCHIRFPSERDVVSEDIPFQCDFLQKSSNIVYLPDCYYYYCLNNTSLTKTFKKEKFLRIKNLHQALVNRTLLIPQALQRIDRLYIGYVRSQIVQMIEMGTDNSKDIVGDVINDEIWNELQKRYKPSYLPIYPRLFYILILYKQIYLIILLSKLVCFIKSAKQLY